MKTINKFVLIAGILIIVINSSQAQGWIQDKKGMYSAGIGAASAVFIPVYDYPGHGRYSQGVSFNISGEYKVHRVLGIGWQTGINIFTQGYYYDKNADFYYNTTSIGIPMGFKMNVHILEAANAPIRNKLDVYAGFNVGGGPSFHGDPYAGAYGFFYVGPQVGVRYWFDKNLAIFGELGWGATFVNFGITF
jgi:hypothetical protein